MQKENGIGLNRKGFTLIELLVAVVLSFILVGAIYGTFTSQQKAYSIQDQVAEAQQNARMSMNRLLRDIRMAGYGMPDGGITIGGTTYSNAIKIQKNDQYQSFDSITLVGAFGAPTGYLDRTISAGSTSIYLRSSDEAEAFDTNDKRYIFIGGIDELQVTGRSGNRIDLNGKLTVRYPTGILKEGVNNGDTNIPLLSASGLVPGDVLSLGTETITVTAISTNTLTVDTDPETAGNQGIDGSYPPGTIINPIPVFRVTAVEYTIDQYTGCLVRADKVAGSQYWPTELAGNIQDIQITPDNLDDQPSYTVTVTARTKNPDSEYTQNGGYRQRVLQSVVKLRNL